MPKGIYKRNFDKKIDRYLNRGSNIVGQRFGRLVVIRKDKLRRSPSGEGRRYYLCKCDCGKEKVIRKNNLIHKHRPTKSCGCIPIEKSRQRQRLSYGEASFNALYLSYKHDAKYRNLVFELNKEQFKKITKENCHYCGTKPAKEYSRKDQSGKEFYGDYVYNGIDRINNNEGYIIQNCVPCCKECNYFKKALSEGAFLGRIKKIYEYRFKKGAMTP